MAKPILMTIDDDAQVLVAIAQDLRRKYEDQLIARLEPYVHKHQGSIRVDSRPGDTRFQVHLPIR